LKCFLAVNEKLIYYLLHHASIIINARCNHELSRY